jgi:predicted nucleotidyltransferase
MVDEYKRIYGDQLKQVYLYGSYARGDYNEESDIDIVALIDSDFSDIQRIKLRKKLTSFSSHLGLKYDVLISPSIINYNTFNEYVDVLPYYQNILKEGVKLYA